MAWDTDDLGVAVARLIVKFLLAEGEPVTVATARRSSSGEEEGGAGAVDL